MTTENTNKLPFMNGTKILLKKIPKYPLFEGEFIENMDITLCKIILEPPDTAPAVNIDGFQSTVYNNLKPNGDLVVKHNQRFGLGRFYADKNRSLIPHPKNIRYFYDLYEDFKQDPLIQRQIEFSNYPKNHDLYNCDRKKVPGLFQDECVDGMMLIVSEYVGLRAKSYANKLWDVESTEYHDKKKSKGVSNRHLQKRIDFNDYKDCLLNEKIISLGKETSKEQHREKIILL